MKKTITKICLGVFFPWKRDARITDIPTFLQDTTSCFLSSYPQGPADKPSLLIIKRIHAGNLTHTILGFTAFLCNIHIQNAMLLACSTWPLISPWCPISLDLWWPSFRSSNIKALKCLVSQPHIYTECTCNYSVSLSYSVLGLPHTVPFTHISFLHLNANSVSKQSADFPIQNVILSLLGLVGACSEAWMWIKYKQWKSWDLVECYSWKVMFTPYIAF